MKKHTKLLLLLFLIISLSGFTQVDTLPLSRNNKFILSMSAGISIPLGDFSFYAGQNYYSNILSGYPKTGFSGKVDVCYLFSKYHFGISLSLLSSINKSWSEYEGSYYRLPTTALGGGTVITSYSYETKNWYFTSILAGLFFEPIHLSGFSLRFWLAGGMLQAICPESNLYQTGYFWEMGQPETPFHENVSQPQMFSYKFALNTGYNFSISLIHKLRAVISFDFLASDAIFHGVITDCFEWDPQQQYRSETPITITKRVYILNCNFGLAYTFN